MKETNGPIQNERRHEKEDRIFEIRIEIRKVNILTGEGNVLCAAKGRLYTSVHEM